MMARLVYFSKWRRLGCLFVFSGLLLLGLLPGGAHAKENIIPSPSVKAVLNAFPGGSIDSVERADEALDAISYENKVLDYQMGKDLDACTKKILVTQCYDQVRLQRKMDGEALRTLSVEANRFKREEKVRLRDAALVDAEQKALAKAHEREASRRKYEEKEGRYIQEKTAAGVSADSPERDVSRERQPHGVDVRAPEEASPPRLESGAYTTIEPSRLKNPDTVLTPEERAANVRVYEEKKQESERKQKEVQRKMAETQEKREKRAAQEAKENAKTAARQKVAKDQ